MKVYVASRFDAAGIEATRKMHAALRERGHEVTHDWTNEEEVYKQTPGDRRVWFLTRAAATDVEAVRKADAVIFMHIENVQMRGAYVEFGIGLGLNKKMITVDAKPGTMDIPGSCIFFMLPQVHRVATIEEAIKALES